VEGILAWSSKARAERGTATPPSRPSELPAVRLYCRPADSGAAPARGYKPRARGPSLRYSAKRLRKIPP
jgi:hypothetical protein